MAISINNGLANIVGTPGAASGVFADRPSATDVAEGTLYFSTDTIAIYQVVAGSWINYSSGGGGGLTSVDNGLVLAPTLTNVQFGGLLIQDTALNCGNFNLDFNNIKVFTAASSNGTNIVLEDDKIYAGINAIQAGYYLNFGSKKYLFGDYGNSNNGTSIIIDDLNEIISTFYNNNEVGLKLDFATEQYQFGQVNGVALAINVLGGQIDLGFGGIGLQLASSGRICYIGDGPGGYNYTNILVDDINQLIKFINTAGSYNFSNIPAYANNAAALLAGLVVGDIYRHNGLGESQDQLRIVH
jgi:hypothetical protein